MPSKTSKRILPTTPDIATGSGRPPLGWLAVTPELRESSAFIPPKIDEADLTPNEFRVLCHLIRLGQENKPSPTVKGIAAHCRMNVVITRKALGSLRSKGWVTNQKYAGMAAQ